MGKPRVITPTPQLGIVFLVKGKLLIASSPVDEGENYGDFKNYPGDHRRYWSELQKMGIVSVDSEYEEHPRGRVVLNRKTGQYSLYLDRCILRRPSTVSRIISKLHLPANAVVATDPHYRRAKCLGRGTTSFSAVGPD
jgi:hypothetical protein